MAASAAGWTMAAGETVDEGEALAAGVMAAGATAAGATAAGAVEAAGRVVEATALNAAARPFVLGAAAHGEESDTWQARCRECGYRRSKSEYSMQHQKLIERGTHLGVCFDCKRAKKEQMRGVCAYCGNCRVLTRDHIVPEHMGGKLTRDNCALVCGVCNRDKGGNEPEAWMYECAEMYR